MRQCRCPNRSGHDVDFALSNEAYTDEELEQALRTAGFDKVGAFASLGGQAVAEETDLPVVVAHR